MDQGMSSMFRIVEGDTAYTPCYGTLIQTGPVLFTDASKYGWAGVLTQPYEEIDESTQLTPQCGCITVEDSDSSPCLIYQWTFQRKPA